MPAAPTNLRVEYSVNPIGIDTPAPRLSWQLASPAQQSAFEVLVASTPELLAQNVADLWDSGQVTSVQSTHIAYAGPTLPSATPAYWKVRVWTVGSTHPTLFSAPASWETGLLQPFEFRGLWLGGKHVAHNHRPDALYFRKSFTLAGDKPIARARLYTTAQGIYVPFLNNQRVGNDEFRPGWTDYKKKIQYQTYDVTSLLQSGPNALGLILSRGWYCGPVAWTKENYGSEPSVLAQLVVTYTDGTTTVIATDKSWRSNSGPILRSNFLAGETYDARFEIPNWTAPTYSDAAWHEPAIYDPPTAALVAQVGPSVKKLLELKPKSITAGKLPGTILVDMGQNMVGYIRLRVRGAAGTTVTLRHAEILDADGTLYTVNLRRATATDQYTLRGDPAGETFEPTFTFHGFRFLELTGYPGTPTADDITGVVIGTDTPATGTFECGVPMLNQLQHNIQWGQRGNFVEVPTDCPQRDERLGWMGDIQVFVRTASFNADVASFLTKWLGNMNDAQLPNGILPDVAPSLPGLETGAPAWADAGCIVPWALYERYGDMRILETCFSHMRRWVDWVHRNNPHCLWDNKRGHDFGDWLSIKADTPKDVLATAYFAHSTDLVALAARALGNKSAELHYNQLAASIRAAFNKAYVDSSAKVKGETQTAYLLALHFNLLPEALRPKATAHLVADLHAKNDHLSTGFVGVSYLLPTLADNGQFDLAIKLLLNDTFPSWGYSIRHGATTIWERWDGWTSDKGFQDPSMNSFNHYAYGSCGDFMYRYLAGINPDLARPGFKRINLRPRPHAAIKHVAARYESQYGPIVSKWNLDGDKVNWQVTVPPNTTATAQIPGGETRELQPGDYSLTGKL